MNFSLLRPVIGKQLIFSCNKSKDEILDLIQKNTQPLEKASFHFGKNNPKTKARSIRKFEGRINNNSFYITTRFTTLISLIQCVIVR